MSRGAAVGRRGLYYLLLWTLITGNKGSIIALTIVRSSRPTAAPWLIDEPHLPFMESSRHAMGAKFRQTVGDLR